MELFKAAFTGATSFMNPTAQPEEPQQDVESDADHEGLDISELGTILRGISLIYAHTHALTARNAS